MRTIKKVHDAEYAPIAGLITYSPLPSHTLTQIDPFLFLNHHGYQVYPPNNTGLPFGPHPHRGMETVTFILEGDIMHKDSSGNQSVITAGGVQWMTAGKGLIHAEVSSDHFKEVGGGLEILQLWLNLPAKLKMAEPFYKGLQSDEIPRVTLGNGKVILNLISGNWEGVEGAFSSQTNVSLSTIYFEPGSAIDLEVPDAHNLFFYVIKGQLEVNGNNAKARQLVEFNEGGTGLSIKSTEASVLLLGHAEPLNEPVIAQGPFVMNTYEEIEEAYEDYRNGKFGIWQF